MSPVLGAGVFWTAIPRFGPYGGCFRVIDEAEFGEGVEDSGFFGWEVGHEEGIMGRAESSGSSDAFASWAEAFEHKAP